MVDSRRYIVRAGSTIIRPPPQPLILRECMRVTFFGGSCHRRRYNVTQTRPESLPVCSTYARQQTARSGKYEYCLLLPIHKKTHTHTRFTTKAERKTCQMKLLPACATDATFQIDWQRRNENSSDGITRLRYTAKLYCRFINRIEWMQRNVAMWKYRAILTP